RTVPGQLTKNELFLMLGLIGLIQQASADPVKDLYQTSVVPIPVFEPPNETRNQDHSDNGATGIYASESAFRNNSEEEFTDFISADVNELKDNCLTSIYPVNTQIDEIAAVFNFQA